MSPRILLTCLLLLFSAVESLQAQAPENEIWAAEMLASNNSTPPASGNWQSVDLPHFWGPEDGDPQGRSIWYRMKLPELQEPSDPAIFINRLYLNAELYIGDIYLGNGGRMQPPVARNWNRPLLFEVSPWIYQDAIENGRYLYVRLVGDPPFGLISPLVVDEMSTLEPVWWRNQFVRIELSRATSVILMLIAVFGFNLWRKLGTQTAGLLAMASGFWLIPIFYAYLQYPPLPHGTMLRLAHIGIDGAGICVILLAIAYFDRLKPLYLKLAIGWLVLVSLINLAVPATSLVRVANLMHLITQFGYLVTLTITLWSMRKTPSIGKGLLSLGLTIILAASVHDVSLSLSQDLNRWRWDVHIGHLATPLLFLLLSWNMAVNFNHKLNRAKQLNETLLDRIQEEKSRLAKSYLDRDELETRNRMQEERERVYQDLHDDLGARLLTVVYRAETNENRDLGRVALQDLRDVVSRSSSYPMLIEPLLQDCLLDQQERANKLMRKLDWDISGPSLGFQYAAADTLLLRRILRELVTLLIHRVGMDNIALQIHCGRAGLEISVTIPDKARNVVKKMMSGLSKRVQRANGQVRFDGSKLAPLLVVWLPHPQSADRGPQELLPRTGG